MYCEKLLEDHWEFINKYSYKKGMYTIEISEDFLELHLYKFEDFETPRKYIETFRFEEDLIEYVNK